MEEHEYKNIFFAPDEVKENTPIYLKSNPMQFTLQSVEYFYDGYIDSISLAFPKIEIMKLNENGDDEKVAFIATAVGSKPFDMQYDIYFNVTSDMLTSESFHKIADLVEDHKVNIDCMKLNRISRAVDVPTMYHKLHTAVIGTRRRGREDRCGSYVSLLKKDTPVIKGYQYSKEAHCMVECEIIAIGAVIDGTLHAVTRDCGSAVEPSLDIDENWVKLEEHTFDLAPTLLNICARLNEFV